MLHVLPDNFEKRNPSVATVIVLFHTYQRSADCIEQFRTYLPDMPLVIIDNNPSLSDKKVRKRSYDRTISWSKRKKAVVAPLDTLMNFFEASLNDLYQNSVEAFPLTTMRQHATHPIKITNLRWTPYVGVRTLFIKALAQNEGKEYNSIVLFKKVNYDGDEVMITASNGGEYSFDKLSAENTDVVLRCNCPDFYWRFNYYNSLDKALYGRKRAHYESKGVCPPANPMEMPGMCKHLMKTAHVLREAGILAD